jgi:protein-S-isoprenylcysteine O-methyltransferase Ste14
MKRRKRAVVRWAAGATVYVLLLGAALFLAAGRLAWPLGWAYVTVLALNQWVVGLVVVPRHPDLVEERVAVEWRVARGWDRPLTGMVSLFGPLATLIVAGLDRRWGWTPALGPAWPAVGLIVGSAGTALAIWAMAVNRFFYAFVRVEPERGHHVVTQGPYRLVRHPGYAGAALFDLATPLILRSWWALVPAALTAGALVLRTALEDRTLRAELDGYRAYTERVPSRLVPWIW